MDDKGYIIFQSVIRLYKECSLAAHPLDELQNTAAPATRSLSIASTWSCLLRVGYDRNRIIRPEQEPEPVRYNRNRITIQKIRLRLTGTEQYACSGPVLTGAPVPEKSFFSMSLWLSLQVGQILFGPVELLQVDNYPFKICTLSHVRCVDTLFLERIERRSTQDT